MGPFALITVFQSLGGRLSETGANWSWVLITKVDFLYCLFEYSLNLACKYLLKVNNRNTRIRCEICSKLTIKTPERRHWCRSSVFNVNFEHISHLVLMFLLLTLNMPLLAGNFPKLYTQIYGKKILQKIFPLSSRMQEIKQRQPD